MKKICVVTGGRADFWLLKGLMKAIESSHLLTLKLIATGAHLSPEFGSTYKLIESEGFKIDHKIEMLVSSDSDTGVVKSIGLGLIGFADALEKIKPDYLLVLGDRFEMLAASISALIQRIPIIHLHGGEKTEGAYDESIRHSISKMANYHFVAAAEYRKRLLQMGEKPNRVFNVGALGLDSIKDIKVRSKDFLERELKIKFNNKNLLITYHPETLNPSDIESTFCQILIALNELKNTTLIFTLPNADNGSRAIIDLINNFVENNNNAWVFSALGQEKYFSLMTHVDGVIGNSSSGIIEAPSFSVGTINIGNRQKGRICASSIINCRANYDDFIHAINTLYSNSFQQKLLSVINPYYSGGAVESIVKILESEDMSNDVHKQFLDLNFEGNY